MNEQQQFEFEELKRQVEDVKFILQKKLGGGSADIKGRVVAPSSVSGAGTVVLGTGDISSAGMFAAGVVDQAAIGANAAGQSEWKDETADITITGTNTSGTASVTSGSIPIGYFLTAFTTPNASYVQLVVSGTTLTATLSQSPGAGNSVSIRVILLKT